MAYSVDSADAKQTANAAIDLARILKATHKDYKLFKPSWDMYLDTYQGIDIFNHLHKHLRESTASLNERKKRAYYLNYCEPVVDLYVHYIFAKQISRKISESSEAEDIEAMDQTMESDAESEDYNEYDSEDSNSESPPTEKSAESQDLTGYQESTNKFTPDSQSGQNIIPERLHKEWEEWLDNVDRQGNSMDKFMADSAKFALALGHVHILIDIPTSPKPLTTEQERIDNNIRPYLVRYYPQDMINFAYDEFGELLWCRFEEAPPPESDPFKLSKNDIKLTAPTNQSKYSTNSREDNKDHYYVTWTRDKWYKHRTHKGGAELLASGMHPLGRVPVQTIYNTRHAKYKNMGKSLIKEISRINIAILNWSSLLDEEIYQKCLNILCLSKQPVSSELVIGTNNTLEYEGSPPFFLSPATDPGNFIAMMMKEAKENIYQLAKLGGSMGQELNIQKSGEAHAYEFNETNKMLAEKATEFELAENNIHKLWFKYLGYTWTGSVDYPDTFSIETFDQDLNTAMSAKGVIASPTLQEELQKKAAAKILKNADKHIVAKVMKEIKASIMQEEQSKKMQQSQQTNQPTQGDPTSQSEQSIQNTDQAPEQGQQEQ